MIHIVIGLARSGKSMFMQMLRAGGIELTYDEDYIQPNQFNENGFFEYRQPGNLLCDPEFRASIDGKAISLVAHEIMFIPFASRKNMKLIRVHRPFKDVENSLRRAYKRIYKLGRMRKRTKEDWEAELVNIKSQLKDVEREVRTFHSNIVVDYNETLHNPRPTAERLAAFVDCPNFDIEAAAAIPKARMCHV